MLKKSLLISSAASNQGKTLLTLALLTHFKKRVRPFKCGPDFIDPQFHKKIAGVDSINLDSYILNPKQLQWTFSHYFDKEVAVVEGVMGYYDGMDKSASAYNVAQILQIPTLLVIDGSGSYITPAALIQGLQNFQSNNTIKAIVFNRVSSIMHYNLLKKYLNQYAPQIAVCGWIKKDLPSLHAIHLGLDLSELQSSKLEQIAKEVLEHIELSLLEDIMIYQPSPKPSYPFPNFPKQKSHVILVNDANLSFVYHDNKRFLEEHFEKFTLIDDITTQTIPKDATLVILPGGYVETKEAYETIQKASSFCHSLKEHYKRGKKIYAECAGFIFLSQKIDEKKMCGILPYFFSLQEKKERLGYYNCNIDTTTIKGHAFHYSKLLHPKNGNIFLYKNDPKKATLGGIKEQNLFATYLHTFWRLYANDLFL